MMAAGVGAIASQQTPEMAHQVAALAAAANLLTTVVGVYFTLFISLPTTIWLYGKLEPVLGRFSRAKADEAVAADAVADETPAHGSSWASAIASPPMRSAACSRWWATSSATRCRSWTRCRACSSSWRWWC